MKELIYRLVDTVTGGKGLKKTINGFPVKLPTRYVNYFPTDYETDNFNFLKRYVKPGDQVLDIGAHIGLFAVSAAQLAGKNGKIYAFEPASETQQLLRQTIAINNMQDVIQPYEAAVGSHTGKITFYVSDIKGDNSNSLVSYKDDRKLNAKEVDIFRIDDFVQQKQVRNLSFIKIDVEGAEYDALCGAIHTLKTAKPVCIVAIHPEPIAAKGDSLEKIYDLIAGCGYNIYYDQQLISRESFCSNKELIDLHIIPA